MRTHRYGWLFLLGGVLLTAGRPAPALADETTMHVTVLPLRYIFVDGDAEKFRAHHWMKDGYVGGLQEFGLHSTLPGGAVLEGEGHALIDQNDLGTEWSLLKEGLGFVKLGFEEFRKYYDGTGGVHRRFATLQSIETDKELALDIGKFEVEAGLTLEGWPDVEFLYERAYKDGAKSRLTWMDVTEASEVRKIAPSWQDIDEIEDVFEVRVSDEVAGVALHGEQRWEFVRSENFRFEQARATTSAAADSKIRQQDQAPESTLMTTTLGAERSWWEDRLFTASGYHYAHLRSREFETLSEYNAAGVLTNFSNPEQKPNNRADNDYDSHAWVGNLMASPWSWLTLGTKFKSEIIKRHGNSTYNRDDDSGTPDGIINGIDRSLTDTKAVRWGEAFSIQMTAIPRTALYTELELEQGRSLLREDRRSFDGPDTGASGVSDNEVFNRETVTNVRRGIFTVGGRVTPWRFLDVTSHVRRRVNNNDYDDQRESNPGSTTARSAFIDEQNVHTNEFATRVGVRPCRWLRSSVRYQYRDDKYATRVESQDTVKSRALSHTYTFDVTVQPLETLLMTAAFSRQAAVVSTPARLNTTINIPSFKANVSSWLLSADYSPTATVTWTNAVLCSWAHNFDDFAATGLPMGADFNRLDLTTGLQWSPRDHTTVGLEYALYRYNPHENVEVGGYTAHGIWLELSQAF